MMDRQAVIDEIKAISPAVNTEDDVALLDTLSDEGLEQFLASARKGATTVKKLLERKPAP